jgi:hypothetical protein
MGYPAATNFAHQRNARPKPSTDGLPVPHFLQYFAAPEGHRFQLSLNRNESLVSFCAPCMV